MKRILLGLILCLFFYSHSWAMHAFSGTYIGASDQGLWGALVADDGVVNIYTSSAKFFHARAGQTQANNMSAATTLHSTEIGDANIFLNVNNDGIVSGSLSSSTLGVATVSGSILNINHAQAYSGIYGFNIDGSGEASMSLSPDGRVLMHFMSTGVQYTGAGFVNSYGTFFGVLSTNVTFGGKIKNGGIDSVWFNDNRNGARYGNIDFRTKNCRVVPKSLSIENTSIPRAGEIVKLKASSLSDCPNPEAYYRFSFCPDYGAANYDPNNWIVMGDGDLGRK